jgi:hypothetical protein
MIGKPISIKLTGGKSGGCASKARALSQVCEMFLYEGVEGSKKEGPKFMQRLVAKQKARVKDS